MALSVCPHCGASVEPTGRRLCPSCGRSFDDVVAIRSSRLRNEVREEVVARLRAGIPAAAVARDLGHLPDDIVREAIEAVIADHRARRFEIARAYLWPGYAAFVGGAAVTLMTWMSADAPIRVIAYGALCYGPISIVAGHLLRRSYPAG